jgi:hypothetical protein
MNVGLKLSDEHCPIGSDIVRLEVFGNSKRKSDIVRVKPDIVGWDWEVPRNTIFSQNSPISSQI